MLAVFAAAGLCWMIWLSRSLSTPPVAHLVWARPGLTSYMRFHSAGELKKEWVPLDRISIHLRRAVVAAEDDLFFEHAGFDWEAIKEAARVNWRRRRFARGASTITMQLARNLYLSPKKTVPRKLKEALIALKIERTLSKDRILELYLNVVEWGEGVYGAEAAARHYFGKSAAALTRDEAAWLAAILPRPRYFDRRRGSAWARQRASRIAARLR